MKQTLSENKNDGPKPRQPIPPPPPPRLQGFGVGNTINESLTKQEIARFWMRKRIEEEEHLLAAIKAAAKIRARNFTEDDYKCFEESLKDDNYAEEKNTTAKIHTRAHKCNEMRVGIKDWWTKSKFAYLNQPAIELMDPSKKITSNYTPHCFTYKPISFYPTSLGVFKSLSF